MSVSLPATLPLPITEYSLVWVIAHPAQDIHCYLAKAGLVPGSHTLILFHTQYPNLPFRSIASDLKSRLENGENLVVLLYSPSFSFPFNYASRLRAAIPDLHVALVYMAPPDRLFIGWALEWCRAAAASEEPRRVESLEIAHFAGFWVKGSFEGTLDVLADVDIQDERGVDVVQIPSLLEANGGGRTFCMAALIVDGNATNVFVLENGSLILHNDMVEPIQLWACHQARFTSRVIVTWDGSVNSTVPLPAIRSAIRAMSTVLGFPVYLFYLHPRSPSSLDEAKWDALLHHPIGCIAFLHRRHRLSLHKTLYITNRLLYPWLRRIPPADWIQLDRNSIPRVTGRSVLTVVGIPAWLDEVDEPRFGPIGTRTTHDDMMPCIPLTDGASSEGGPLDGYTHSLHVGDNVSVEKWIASFPSNKSSSSVSMAPAPPHSLNSSSSQLGSPPSSMTQMFKLPAFTQAPGPLTDSQSDSQGLRRLPSTFQNAAGFTHSQSQSDLAEESPAAAQLKPANTRSATRHLNLATLGVLPQQAGKLGADRARANESGSDTDDGDEDERTAQVDDWDAEEVSPKARARGKRKAGTTKSAKSSVPRKRKLLEAGISDEEEERDFGAADKNEQSDGGGDDDDDFPVRRHKRARRSLAQAIADVSESTEPAVSKEPSILPPTPPTVAKLGPKISPSLSDLPPMPRFEPNRYLRPDADTQTHSSQPLSESSTSGLTGQSPSAQPKLSLIESLFGAGRGVNASRPPVRSAVSLAPLVQTRPVPVPPARDFQRPTRQPAAASVDGKTQVQVSAPAGNGARQVQGRVTSIVGNLLGARPAPAALAREAAQVTPAPGAVLTAGLSSRATNARPLESRPGVNAGGGGLLSDMLFAPRKGGKPWSVPGKDAK